jgi:hypothetical protein
MHLCKAADTSVVVSRVIIQRDPVVLRGYLRLCAKYGSSGFFRSRALLSTITSCSKESHGSEAHDTLLNRHLCENLQSQTLD